MADTPKPTPKQPSHAPKQGGPEQADGGGQRGKQFAPAGWMVGLLLALTLLLIVQQFRGAATEIPYTLFRGEVLAGNVVEARLEGRRLYGKLDRELFVTKQGAVVKRGKDPAPSEEPASGERPGADSESADGGESTQTASPGGAADPTAEEPSDSTAEADAQAGPAGAEGGSDAEAKPTDEAADAAADGAPADEAGEADKPIEIGKQFFVVIPGEFDSELRQLLDDNGVRLVAVEPFDWGSLMMVIWFALLIGLAFVTISFFRRTRDQMMGGGMLSGVTKSPARRYDSEEAERTTFDDVAGLAGVKKDLQEIVEFLREPEKFQRLGARVPKGVLLNGPPGTGKTLLAKAVAGEAGVPFFSINGSEFIQLFVGVGASRVRDMFKTAKRNAPAILFIDEIDAVGRQRGAGLGGGHDEREQTLNQILSEMDGFTPSETVIVIAATNRPDVLDPALLRPGRFDRHITVDPPPHGGGRPQFDVHTRNVPVGDDVDIERLARGTTGLTGADIANLINEAALWATRNDRSFVTMEDFEYARDKALMGSTREDVLTEEERRMTAYHEAGHALVAWKAPGCDPVHKVTIVPRGRALGVTQLIPDEDRHSQSETEMHATLAMALGGRAAEKLVFDEYSNGASSDLDRATQLARRMVTHWGMSERLGPVAHHGDGQDPFLGREIVQEQRQYSEHTARIIDEEVAAILHGAADRATRLLTENRQALDDLTNALLEREEIDEREIAELIGERTHGRRSTPATAGANGAPAESVGVQKSRGD